MVAPHLENYPEINNNAHRKAAELIGAPSLVWHQALWDSRHDGGTRKERARRIEVYLKALYARIKSLCEGIDAPAFDTIKVDYLDRVRVITFIFKWKGMRTKIRFEIHTEYLAVTSIVDLSVDLSTAKVSKEKLAQNEHYTLLKDKFDLLHALLSRQRVSAAGEEIAVDEKTKAELGELHTYLYETFWNGPFDGTILDWEGHLATGALGKRFADFRGVITCERYPPALERAKENLETSRIELQPLLEPFYRTNEDARGQWHRVRAPDENWARARLNGAWPFLTAVHEPLPGRREYTVSRPLEGLQFYASALGPQPREDAKVEHARPVFFYFHSATQCERQIGRTIDRLFQLGTLRLAAIIALPQFKSLSQELRAVEQKIKAARDQVHKLVLSANKIQTYASAKLSEIRQRLSAIIVKDFDEIQTKMAEIRAGTPEGNEILGDESLDYRISRSIYYKNQFNTLVKDLREIRLEGYQLYEEFVRRRLSSPFGFLDSVERRLRDISAEWRSLDQLYLSTVSSIMTGEIEETQTVVRNLQWFAEFVLIIILAPYYLFSLWDHYSGCFENKVCNVPVFEFHDTRFAINVIVGGCLVGLIWRQWRAIKEWTRTRSSRLVAAARRQGRQPMAPK
jgi:hypothetical protein